MKLLTPTLLVADIRFSEHAGHVLVPDVLSVAAVLTSSGGGYHLSR